MSNLGSKRAKGGYKSEEDVIAFFNLSKNEGKVVTRFVGFNSPYDMITELAKSDKDISEYKLDYGRSIFSKHDATNINGDRFEIKSYNKCPKVGGTYVLCQFNHFRKIDEGVKRTTLSGISTEEFNRGVFKLRELLNSVGVHTLIDVESILFLNTTNGDIYKLGIEILPPTIRGGRFHTVECKFIIKFMEKIGCIPNSSTNVSSKTTSSTNKNKIKSSFNYRNSILDFINKNGFTQKTINILKMNKVLFEVDSISNSLKNRIIEIIPNSGLYYHTKESNDVKRCKISNCITSIKNGL